MRQNEAGTAAGLLAHRFVAALASRDAAALESMLSSEVDFQAMTPRRVWQAGTAAQAVQEIVLGAWFGPEDVVERVEAVEVGAVGTRTRLGYRLRVASPGGRFTVGQQAFLDVNGGVITWLRVLCSGFQPDPGPRPPAAGTGHSE